MVLTGAEAYTSDQVKVEPNFSPANEAERRAVYDAERKFVKAFEYADLPVEGFSDEADGEWRQDDRDDRRDSSSRILTVPC